MHLKVFISPHFSFSTQYDFFFLIINMSPINLLFQLVSQLQHSPSPFPPQRPLPLSPARGAFPTGSPARRQGSKSSPGLLVMMPPAVGPKPVGKVSAIPPLRALRWATAQHERAQLRSLAVQKAPLLCCYFSSSGCSTIEDHCIKLSS